METVAFVPIKLNSVRLPDKNILPLAGKPLCWHMLNTLSQVEGIDYVYVYCSDENIKAYIPDSVNFLQRPGTLDADLVKGEEIYRSFIDKKKANVYVLAHVTSPFTKISSVKGALDRVLRNENDSAFSVRKFQTFAWYKNSPVNYDHTNIPRTQDIEPIYVETSAFYVFKREHFTEHNRRIGFNPFMQVVDEMEAIDIDYQEDYELAKLWAEVHWRDK